MVAYRWSRGRKQVELPQQPRHCVVNSPQLPVPELVARGLFGLASSTCLESGFNQFPKLGRRATRQKSSSAGEQTGRSRTA